MILKHRITLLLILSSLVAFSFEPFGLRKVNKFELNFDRYEGGSFYDSEGNRNILKRDSLDVIRAINQEGTEFDTLRNVNFQSSHQKTYFDIGIGGNYFIMDNWNLKGSIAFRNATLNRTDEFGPEQNIDRPTIEQPEISQTLLMPISLGTEYFIDFELNSSSSFFVIPSLGASMAFGSAKAFEDSTLFGNGVQQISAGLNLGYETKELYLQAGSEFLSRSEEFSNQIRSNFAIEFRNVKNVQFFVQLENVIALDVEPGEFMFELPQTNDSYTNLRGGAFITINRLVASFYISQFLIGENTLDRSAYGFGVKFLFN
jgi:hypothetical protein